VDFSLTFDGNDFNDYPENQLTKFHPLPSRLGGLRESCNTTRLFPMNCEELIYSLQASVMLKMLVLKIHNLTFNDAKIDFNDTQFV